MKFSDVFACECECSIEFCKFMVNSIYYIFSFIISSNQFRCMYLFTWMITISKNGKNIFIFVLPQALHYFLSEITYVFESSWYIFFSEILVLVGKT